MPVTKKKSNVSAVAKPDRSDSVSLEPAIADAKRFLEIKPELKEISDEFEGLKSRLRTFYRSKLGLPLDRLTTKPEPTSIPVGAYVITPSYREEGGGLSKDALAKALADPAIGEALKKYLSPVYYSDSVQVTKRMG